MSVPIPLGFVEPLPFNVTVVPTAAVCAGPAFATGAQVEHGKFGLGSVLSCNDDYIVIKFDEHGEKKFVTPIVLPALKKSDRQPPVEKRRATRKKAAPAAASGA